MLITIDGYQINEQIYESSNSQVYRGVRLVDNQAVILKLLQGEYPTPQQLTNYRQEFEMTRSLAVAGVVKMYELLEYRNSWVMVVEDFGGQSLKSLKLADNLSLAQFLQLAIQLSEILGQVHQQQIMHKDINPANVVLNLTTQEIKLIDFGISTRLSREYTNFCNPNSLEGTLAYISPEQTGRMNRVVDYRTDLYSLGVTLYELLTGRLPFEEEEPLALVHAHMAKTPPDFRLGILDFGLADGNLKASFEIPLKAIIMKLLAKNAEDRYQSAFGLKYDLEQVQASLAGSRDLSDFTLGQHDFSSRFQIPQKLYGREAEIETLLAAFERIAQPESEAEIILVAGYSGVGKSALVHEIHKPVTARRGYFVSGKYDQFQRNVPYYALTQALNEFCNLLLAETEASLTEWKKKILMAVGNNGQVLIEVIPNLEWVIGKQPVMSEVGPKESQNRFNMVFQNFMKAINRPEHPLVLFIDDLQWADMASLELFKQMLKNVESQHLLLIGAYRDNEVTESHPFMLTMAELSKAGVQVRCLNLPNLTEADVTALVADTLQCDSDAVGELVDLLYEKTQGNAFFLTQFLTTLYEQGLINFGLTEGNLKASFEIPTEDPPSKIPNPKWSWNVARIRELNMSDNVVELMASKLARLDESTQTMLKFAACIGNTFALSTLAIISEQTPHEALLDLWSAVDEGVILPLDENYRQILVTNLSGLDSHFKFLHDRVRQAAYLLIAEADRAALHLKIGRLWLTDMGAGIQNFEHVLFDVVNQLNAGRECLEDEAEKLQLAELNLQAGQKVKSAIAYQTALSYVTTALALLPKDSWVSHHQLTFKLMTAQAECQYLMSQLTEAEATFKLALEHAQTNLEKGYIFSALVLIYTYQLDIKQWTEASSQGLQVLGLAVPMAGDAVSAAIKQSLGQIQAYLADKEMASVLDLPELTDETKLKAMNLCIQMLPVAYTTGNLNLYTLLGLKMVTLSLESGNSIFATYAYTVYGSILVMSFGDYQRGYEWGCLGLQLAEKYPPSVIQVKNYHIFSSFINHWRQPAKSSVNYFLQGYTQGIGLGDLASAGYLVANYTMMLLFMGANLAFVEQETIKYFAFVQKTKEQVSINLFLAHIFLILALSGQDCFHETSLTKKTVSQAVRNSNSKSGLSNYLTYQLKVDYLYGHYSAALQAVQENTSLIGQAAGKIILAEFYFYHALTLVALWPTLAASEQATALETITAHHARIKTWRENCPANFEGMDLLLSAEMARLHGQEMASLQLYDQAIASTKEHEFIHLQALANELAAKFWLSLDKPHIARHYWREAHYAYQKWGATVKVTQLEEQYPELRVQTSQAFYEQTMTTSQGRTSKMSSHMLDLASVLKASQAISGEIELLDTLMRIVIENAGAQKGYLVLNQQDEWVIVAEVSPPKSGEKVRFEPMPLKQVEHAPTPLLPVAIVNYVIRTRQPLVLNNASQDTHEGRFANDRYIVTRQPKSVLCMPLLYQGKIIGLVYLENNLSPGVFTPDRLEVLNLLSSQAAISLENARLYLDLQSSEQKYRTIFESSNDVIYITLPDGRIIDINSACFNLLGYTRAEMLQLNVVEVCAEPTDRQRFRKKMDQHGMVKDFEVTFRRKDHQLIDVLITATLWRNRDSTTVGYQGIIRDVTALKQAERERLQLSTIQRELTIAREIQNSLLPPPKPTWPGLEVVCYSTPAKEVGGDFYKYHLTPEKYIFAIGDVSGKGVSASLLMATSLSQFDASLALNLEATERMAYLDTVISPYTKPKKQNCAMTYVEINPVTNELQMINAGCIPPYIKRADGSVETLEIGGFALGQGHGAKMGYQSITRPFAPGDLVILTSDGVVEANNPAGKMLGFEKLESLVQQGPTTSAEAMLEYLKQAIFAFTQGAEPHDDLTIMVVQLKNLGV